MAMRLKVKNTLLRLMDKIPFEITLTPRLSRFVEINESNSKIRGTMPALLICITLQPRRQSAPIHDTLDNMGSRPPGLGL